MGEILLFSIKIYSLHWILFLIILMLLFAVSLEDVNTDYGICYAFYLVVVYKNLIRIDFLIIFNYIFDVG